jgi:transposase-like protein
VNRLLIGIYPIVWLTAMHYYKVRNSRKIVFRAVYNIQTLNTKGRNELIRIYISQSERTNFWLLVHYNIKSHGINDILIVYADYLTEFSNAI